MTFKNPFSKPTPIELATQELQEAQEKLLEAQTGLEYAKAMVEYNTNRVARLQEYLENHRKHSYPNPPKNPHRLESAI